MSATALLLPEAFAVQQLLQRIEVVDEPRLFVLRSGDAVTVRLEELGVGDLAVKTSAIGEKRQPGKSQNLRRARRLRVRILLREAGVAKACPRI